MTKNPSSQVADAPESTKTAKKPGTTMTELIMAGAIFFC